MHEILQTSLYELESCFVQREGNTTPPFGMISGVHVRAKKKMRLKKKLEKSKKQKEIFSFI